MLKPEQRAPFARTLEPLLITIPIDRYLRVSHARHRGDPLGMAPGSTRFSPTKARRADERRSFLVLYLAETLATALYETVVRHALDYQANRVLHPFDYADRVLFTISTTARRARITLLDLTNQNARRYGVPTDVLRHSEHDDGQDFAELVYDHLSAADGILYPSRFTGRRCVAVFERGKHKLVEETTEDLTRSMVRHALKAERIDVY